jgi:hypothetical protein
MKKILFLGCNHAQIPYLRELKQRGLKIIGTDSNKDSPGKDLCDSFLNVGYNEIEDLIAIGDKEKFSPTDYVFTAAAQFAQLGAAVFARQFGIKFPSVETVKLCLDKAAYYDYFKTHGIPLPETTYVKTERILKTALSLAQRNERYYLKSDYSKNPNYVYCFSADDVPWDEIFWGRDRYLRSKYILQREFPGVSLRINIYGDRFNVYDFGDGKKTQGYHEVLLRINLISMLRKLVQDLGLSRWLIKFDVILSGEDFAVLDIGMDPPFRMVGESNSRSINFAKHYLDQYLLGKVTYPQSLD